MSYLERVSAKQAPAEQTAEGSWLSENVWKPLVNGSGVLQVYNTFASDKADLPQIHQQKTGSLEWASQSLFGAAGAILPYVIAGKCMGAGMSRFGAEIGAEGALGRMLASERGAQILGAGAYDFIKAPNANETRLGNALGSMAAFSVFEFGNAGLGLSKTVPMLSSAKAFSAQLLGRATVGAVGATTGLEVSHFYNTGHLADAKDTYNAMATGAFLNVALPTVQDGIGKVITGVGSKFAKPSLGALDQQANLATKLEDLPKPVERVALTETQTTTLRNATDFAHELTAKYPQVNADGKLNYYLAGSLGTMLMIEAGGKLNPLKGASISGEATAPVHLTAEGMNHLSGFIRKIGDLDFVPLEGYKQEPVRMGKGGAGPSYDELSQSARDIFKSSKDGGKVMCDPVSAAGEHKIVAVEVGGKTFYVADPITALSYKAIHAAESFGNNESKAPQMNSDFSALLNGLKGSYSRDELVRATYDTMKAYGGNRANGLYTRDFDPSMSPEFKTFLQDVVALDPNASYLSKLQYGQERSFGILKILDRMQTDSAKNQLIDFINENRGAIDLWTPTSSENNRMAVAAEILRNPAELQRFTDYTNGKEPTLQNVADYLQTHTGHLREIASTMPPGTLDRVPTTTYMLNALMRVNEATLPAELKTINALTAKGVEPFTPSLILEAPYTQGPARSSIFSDLQKAAETLTPDKLDSFLYKYKEAVVTTQDLDMTANKWIQVTEAERPARVETVMKQFGLR